MTTNVFADFEQVELPEGATKIVFGVNVLQVQAEVKSVETGTVAELVAKYREQLGLPQDVVVFVDGTKLSGSDRIPADAKRIELVKPAGSKGSDLSNTPKIELADEDAIHILILAEDTILCQVAEDHPYGKVEKTLLEDGIVSLMDQMEVLSEGHIYVTVGYRHWETTATRKALRPLSQIRRRAQGGAAESRELLVNDVTFVGQPIRVEINGEPDGNCRPLAAGETLLVVFRGEEIAVDYTALADRANSLAEMGWIKLRALGAKMGVKVAGSGRNSDAIRCDILRVEFPELLPENVDDQWITDNWLFPETE